MSKGHLPIHILGDYLLANETLKKRLAKEKLIKDMDTNLGYALNQIESYELGIVVIYLARDQDLSICLKTLKAIASKINPINVSFYIISDIKEIAMLEGLKSLPFVEVLPAKIVAEELYKKIKRRIDLLYSESEWIKEKKGLKGPDQFPSLLGCEAKQRDAKNVKPIKGTEEFMLNKSSTALFVKVENKTDHKKLLLEVIDKKAQTIAWSGKLDFKFQCKVDGDPKDLKNLLVSPLDPVGVQKHLKNKKSKALFFCSNLRRSRLIFNTSVVGDFKKGKSFVIKPPSYIYQVQRRFKFRLPVDVKPFSVTFHHLDQDWVRDVLDIGAGGMAFVVPTNEKFFFKRGHTLKNLRFNFRGQPFTVKEAEVRYFARTPNTDVYRVGLCFTKIKSKDATTIDMIVYNESLEYLEIASQEEIAS